MDGFPSFDNYNSMFRGGFAAHMAMNQLDLAKQFAEQKRRENESNIEAKTLANQYAQQRNPLLLDEQKLKLNELQRADQLESEGFQDTREAQKRKFALKLSEDKIKELEQVAQLNLYDADPEKQKKGLALLNMHKDFVKFREQEAERRITNKQESDARIELEKQRASNQKALEQLRIDAGKYNRGKVATTVDDQLAKVRDARQAAEILENAYYVAIENNDMAAAARYKERAQMARARAAEDANNRAIGQPGLSVGAGGQLTDKPRAAANAPIAGVNPQNPLINSQQIPDGAIQMLRANPNLRAQFDAKYGQGAATLYLGK